MASEENIGKLYRIAQQNEEEIIEYSNFRNDLLRTIDKDLDVDEVIIKMLEISQNQTLGSYKNGVFVFSTDVMNIAEKSVREESRQITENIEQENVIQNSIIKDAKLSDVDLRQMVSNFSMLTREEKMKVIDNFSRLTVEEQQIVGTQVLDLFQNAVDSELELSEDEKKQAFGITAALKFQMKKMGLIGKYNSQGISKEDKENVIKGLVKIRRDEIKGFVDSYYRCKTDEERKIILEGLSEVLQMDEKSVKRYFLLSDVELDENIDKYLNDLSVAYLQEDVVLDETGNPPAELIYKIRMMHNEFENNEEIKNYYPSNAEYVGKKPLNLGSFMGRATQETLKIMTASVDDQGKLIKEGMELLVKMPGFSRNAPADRRKGEMIPKIPGNKKYKGVTTNYGSNFVEGNGMYGSEIESLSSSPIWSSKEVGLLLSVYGMVDSRASRSDEILSSSAARTRVTPTAVDYRDISLVTDKPISQDIGLSKSIISKKGTTMYGEILSEEMDERFKKISEDMLVSSGVLGNKDQTLSQIYEKSYMDKFKESYSDIDFNVIKKAEDIVAETKETLEDVSTKDVETKDEPIKPFTIEEIVVDDNRIGSKDIKIEESVEKREENLPKKVTMFDKMKQGLFKLRKKISDVAKSVIARVGNESESNSNNSANVSTSNNIGNSKDTKKAQAPVDYLNQHFEINVKQAVMDAKVSSDTKDTFRKQSLSSTEHDDEQL